MTVEIAEQAGTRSGHLAAEAIASLATRVSFLVAAWLLVTGDATLAQTAAVAGAQVLAYLVCSPFGVWLAGRTRPILISVGTDLLSAAGLAAVAFFYTDVLLFGAATAGVAALRALGDRARNAHRVPDLVEVAEDQAPARTGLTRAGLFLLGGAAGAAATWLGPAGALWFTAMAFAASAAVTVWASGERAAPDAFDGEVTHQAGLWHDKLVRRLLLVLLLTGLLAQAAAVLIVEVWLREALPVDETLGYVAGAFGLGAIAGGVLLTSLIRHPGGVLALCLGYVGGGAVIAVRDGIRPILLIIVLVALIAGVAFSSVTPALGTLLSRRVPSQLRARAGGVFTSVAYLGIPAGTAGAVYLQHRYGGLLVGVCVGGGLLIVAMLVPVLAYRPWGLLSAAMPSVTGMLGSARLPARLTVTLAYANGEWLIEVRRGRALLGKRHLVKSAEALSMLSMLDVPGVHAKVEQALTVDQSEATRQVERMRTELAEMEAKLAGLTEMVELTDSRKSPPPPPAAGGQLAAQTG